MIVNSTNIFTYLSFEMMLERFKKHLEKLKKMIDAGIAIPENLLQAINSLEGQLEPFLKYSPEKADFDALERHELIKEILFSILRIFYDDVYQRILLEHKQFSRNIGEARFNQSYSESVRKEDISTRLTQIHTMLVAQWKSPIPPPIEQICLPPSLITHEMLYSYFEDGQSWGEKPEYGYQEEPSLAQDTRPLSFKEYITAIFKKSIVFSNKNIAFFKYICKNIKASTLPLIIYN